VNKLNEINKQSSIDKELYEIFLLFLEILWNKYFLEKIFENKILENDKNDFSTLLWKIRYWDQIKENLPLLKDKFKSLFLSYDKQFGKLISDWLYWTAWKLETDSKMEELFDFYRNWLNTFQKIENIIK